MPFGLRPPRQKSARDAWPAISTTSAPPAAATLVRQCGSVLLAPRRACVTCSSRDVQSKIRLKSGREWAEPSFSMVMEVLRGRPLIFRYSTAVAIADCRYTHEASTRVWSTPC